MCVVEWTYISIVCDAEWAYGDTALVLLYGNTVELCVLLNGHMEVLHLWW